MDLAKSSLWSFPWKVGPFQAWTPFGSSGADGSTRKQCFMAGSEPGYGSLEGVGKFVSNLQQE